MGNKILPITAISLAALVGIIVLISTKNKNVENIPFSPTIVVTQKPMEDVKELKIEDLQEGTGEAVKSGDTVTINYKGTLLDGTKFDSSYDRGTPFETQIGVGGVIEGWDKGVVGMKVGGKRKLTIPSRMAYGEQGAGPIPPNSPLIFELELLGIK